MSYLNVPRLTFSGQFQADPSTVNNDPTHFNNATFQPNFQNYSTADDQNGWWNPDGTGNWKFIGCKITSVTYLDGTSTSDSSEDPVIGMSIMDTDARTAGKIVDLDSQQQMVSELWGLIVRIVDLDGINMMKGDYEVAPFTNIWFNRSVDKKADEAAGAVYQSVIKNITWNENYTNSRYLNELMSVSSKELSIQFTVDRYHGDNTSPEFTIGRIAGSIGPSYIGEPKHFVPGRQLFPMGYFTTPPVYSNNVNFATALINEDLGQIVVDLSNSLQFSTGGVVNPTGDLRLAISVDNGNYYFEIGKIDYLVPDWYMKTSGICTFPLNTYQMGLIYNNPLAIVQAITGPQDVFTPVSTTTYQPLFNESIQYVRADKFVFRLDPGDVCTINFYATNLGQPFPNATINLQDATASFMGPTPPAVGVPALLPFTGEIPATTTTDSNGKASFSFTAPDPGNPRGYIDGQVYGISYNLNYQAFSYCNQANFVSLMIYSGILDYAPPYDWDNFIQPIMQQYANLYPLMSKGIFNLADKTVVDKNAELLYLVFSKDREDPNYMPATRDLSGFKRRVILSYLENIIG